MANLVLNIPRKDVHLLRESWDNSQVWYFPRSEVTFFSFKACSRVNNYLGYMINIGDVYLSCSSSFTCHLEGLHKEFVINVW